MSFFEPNVTCVKCEKEIGLNRFKTNEGWMCPACFKKSGAKPSVPKGVKIGCGTIIGFFILIFFIGLISTPNTQEQSVSVKPKQINQPSPQASTSKEYSIIKESPNDHLSKNSLDILLKRKVDTQTLRQIAYGLLSSRKEYERLWIFYYLPGMTPGHGAWAISHFTPESGVEIEILGSSIKQDKEMESTPSIPGTIIGKWQNNIPAYTMTIVKQSDSLKIITIHKDGSSSERSLRERKYNGKTRCDYIEYFHGEYFILENNGNLGMYGNNGKFGEASKIN